MKIPGWVGVAPFLVFAFLFLLLPSAVLLAGAFFGNDGQFTLQNLIDLGRPRIVAAYAVTVQLSALTAGLGLILGFLLAWSVTMGGLPSSFKGLLSTFSGVASNFGGVPLAFAFIATLGRVGLVTALLKGLGLDIYDGGFSLYTFTGLTLTYLYFQLPLMVLIITPSLEGMKKEWREASVSLGGGRWTYWVKVGLPVLTPPLLAAFLLLFGNAFGAYATAYALTGGVINLIPILIGAQIRAMFFTIRAWGSRWRWYGGHHGRFHPDLHLGPPPGRPLGSGMKKKFGFAAVLYYTLGSLYFLVPLVATFLFSLRGKKDELGFLAYANVFGDPNFVKSFGFSLEMAVLTVVLSLGLLVPTVVWVHLRAPKWKWVLDLFSLLPFVVPPVVLAFGYIRLYGPAPFTWASSPLLLAAGYVVLCFPFVYRSLDAGLRAIDLNRLWEAGASLGAGPVHTLFRVVLPNLRSALLSAVFLTFATVLGELTLAVLLAWPAFGPYMALVGRDRAYEPAALAVISFALTWGSLGLIHLFSRGDHGVSRTR